MTPFAPLLTQNLPLYAQAGAVPPSPAPASPIQIVQPPDLSTTTSQVGPTVTTRVPSAGSAQAITDMTAASQRRREADAQALAAKPQELDLAAQEQEQIAASMEAEQRQRAAAQAANAAEVKRRMDVAEQARQQAQKDSNPSTYWADQSAPAKILAGFLMILGGAASGLARTRNGVAEAYAQAAEDDKQRKLRKYQASSEYAKLKDQDVTAAQAGLVEKLRQISDDGIVNRRAIKEKMLAVAKRSGIPGALATATAEAAKLDLQEAKDLAQQQAHYDKQVQSGHTTTSTTVNKSGTNANNDRLVYGKGGEAIAVAPTPKAAEAANKSNASFQQLDALLGDLQASYEAKGKFINPLGEESSKRKAIGGQAVIAYKNLAELGALSGPDMGLVDDAISGGWTGDQAIAKLKQARASLAKSQASFLDTRGLAGSELTEKLAPTAGRPSQPVTKPGKSKTPSADRAIELQQVDAELRKLPLDDPKRPRWEAMRKRIVEMGGQD